MSLKGISKSSTSGIFRYPVKIYDHKLPAAFSFHDKHTINAHLQSTLSVKRIKLVQTPQRIIRKGRRCLNQHSELDLFRVIKASGLYLDKQCRSSIKIMWLSGPYTGNQPQTWSLNCISTNQAISVAP